MFFFLLPIAYPLSCLWAFAAFFRRKFLKRRYRPKTILIGSLHAGGTGKTPFTIALSKRFPSFILYSHGYRSKLRKQGGWVESLDPLKFGDEAVLLAQIGRVYMGRDRIRGIEEIRKVSSGWILLDDGFQHLNLRAEVAILTLPATVDEGSLYCFPVGKLREPFSSINEADAFLILDPQPESIEYWAVMVDKLAHGSPIFKAFRKVKIEPHPNPSETYLAFCGIGNASAFQRSVEALGACYYQSFPDHFSYHPQTLLKISEERKKRGFTSLLTTQKDCVKIGKKLQEMGEKVGVLREEIEIEEAFWKWLDGKIC